MDFWDKTLLLYIAKLIITDYIIQLRVWINTLTSFIYKNNMFRFALFI